jgi:predicted transcriptional regulator
MAPMPEKQDATGSTMVADTKHQASYPHLVTKIIASYVSHHSVSPEQIPELINCLYRILGGLGKPSAAQSTPNPAVPLRRSVQRDVVVCLECGWRGKMLRRHLSTRHGLAGEQYLKRWSLASDHPLTAPNYSEQRSSLAKELGLGRGGRPAADSPPTTQAAPGQTPRRRGRPRGSGRPREM